jgi:GT2 family glycosyltransferase/glycosyltransferase involved in cell wall biosynthesis
VLPLRRLKESGLSEASRSPIDIIIPVFRGEAAVRRCIESVLASVEPSQADLIIVDDASPEPAISSYLSQIAKQQPHITLISNEDNLGFVQSVLAASSLHPDRDLVLLNSDTEVSGDWLSRLLFHLDTRATVATVTPFSNNATIASYPVLAAENRLPEGLSVGQLLALFARANHQKSELIPTAVGFCVLIRRTAWQLAGGFDEVYGRGYGEEVDLCRRLSAAGWEHVLAADTFVFHEGAVSFGADSSTLKQHAQREVDKRFPDFQSEVAGWIEQDPALELRLAVDLERLSCRRGPRWLFICHNYGGGVQQHVDDLARMIREQADGAVWALSPEGLSALRLSWLGEDSDLSVSLPVGNWRQPLADLVRFLGIQRLHFHHVAGMPADILSLPEMLDLPFDVTIHDFLAVCPQTHFITEQGDFCGRPDASACQACVNHRPDQWGWGIEGWRGAFASWLDSAERIIFPSQSVRSIIRDYYPNVDGEVWPHPEPDLSRFVDHGEQSLARRKIALLGSLSEVKGFALLRQVVELSEARDDALDFVVIGPTTRSFGAELPANLTILGQYDATRLPRLLARERPDAILFLSRVPETYNYALSAALETGLPIWALDAGAIGERLEGVERAFVLPLDASAEQVLAALLQSASVYALKDPGSHSSMNDLESVLTYARNYLKPLDGRDAPALQSTKLIDLIARLRRQSPPVVSVERSIEELLEQGLDCRLDEARQQLRQQALENERQLEQRTEHLAIQTREVTHLLSTIEELKQAHQIHERELVGQIGEIKARLDERDREYDEAEQRHGSQLAALEETLREIENSTFWRATAPLRWSVHQIKRAIASARRKIEWCRRAWVFVRYHYGLGGWSALRSAVLRRVRSGPARTYSLELGAAGVGALADLELDSASVLLNTSAAPRLSIVIPTYGAHGVTKRCLASIALNEPSVPYEVLVVDDAFKEPFDAEALAISGLTVIQNEDNLGFLKSCNAAALRVRGDRLLLLNNDTVVHGDAIDQLYHTFHYFDDVGAVCAQLRFENGSLQEAGGIVWRDGSAWNWGRGERPDDPRFTYVREVDYGSAAALMVDMELWRSLGGFDERYLPAYYEDTDFCFSIRQAGHRVLYQPAAVVTHFEGMSHGTDVGSGVKASQLKNQSVFAEKWAQVLETHRANGVAPMLERDRRARARVLWVEACMLTPNQDSGSLRTLRLLRILCRMGCKVTFIADNLDGEQAYRRQLEQEGVEVVCGPYEHSVESYIRLHGRHFDVITLCRHYIAIQYVDLIRREAPGAQLWFDTIDLHYLRLRRQHELDGKKSTLDRAQLAHEEELQVIGRSDVTLVVSQVEVVELAREAPGARVAVVSNIHEAQGDAPPRENRRGVMFVGGFQHPPNIDAVEFFAAEVWPLYRAQVEGAQAFIIGSKMPEKLKKLGQSQGLTMLGFVEDLAPYYGQCLMTIAPLRYGAGVKGKVNQALSFGIPVVGTSAAFEGMSVKHGEHVLIADTAAAFAEAMLSLHEDEAVWNRLSAEGPKSLASEFSPEIARSTLRELLSDILA